MATTAEPLPETTGVTDHGRATAPRPEGAIVRNLRTIGMVWRREIIRFRRSPARIVSGLAQPVLFLFVLGAGIKPLVGGRAVGDIDFQQFIFPGVIAMSVLFSSLFSAISIVWDREFGFLREMLVAPVRRSSIVLGKCLGGATVAAFQGVIVIAMAGLVDVPYAPVMLLEIFALQVLLAFAITAFGVMAAARINQMQSFMALTQMLIMPMFFISGALFPVSQLPAWLAVLNRVDPLTYAVDPMRRVVFSELDITPAARAALDPGVTWFGWHVPGLLEAAMVALLGAGMLAVAILEFGRAE
jgi:ABC-2 type transport system permease protein